MRDGEGGRGRRLGEGREREILYITAGGGIGGHQWSLHGERSRRWRGKLCCCRSSAGQPLCSAGHLCDMVSFGEERV